MNQHVVKDISQLTDQECALQIGKRFAIARQSLGLTPQGLAQFLGTTTDKITEVEQGKLFLPIPWGVKLSKCLGINVNWILTGEEEIRIEKPRFYNDLIYHMKVPIIEQNVFNALIKTKTIFNEQINEFERVHDISLSGGLK